LAVERDEYPSLLTCSGGELVAGAAGLVTEKLKTFEGYSSLSS
jgi:hypothetical protein